MESFNKFKKKIMLEVLLKSIMIGLSIGLISFSIPFIYIKVNGIKFNILFVVLISITVALLMFGITYLILKPNKVKIAKRIDEELNLNQKVQTMVEYETKDNFMVSLQRENTLNILSNIPVKNLGMKFGIVLFLILGLSFVSCITSFAIPAYKEPEVVIPDDPTYEVDDWTILAIKDIIEKVEISSANLSLKNKYIDMLEGLIRELENNIDKESQMKEYVLKLIDGILLELDKVNTNNEIFVVLRDSSNSLVSSLAVEINLLDINDIIKQIQNIAALINGNADAITEFDNDFRRPLQSSNLDMNDDLYKGLIKLANEIYEAKNASNVGEKVNEVIANNIDNIVSIVEHQVENYRIAHYIEYELKNIFSLHEKEDDGSEEDEEDKKENPFDDENDNNKNQQQDNSGGLGTGDILFGSDDEFFDPEKGIVIYGDVVTSYYGEILGKLNEGMLDENLREYFEYYYKILLGDGNLDKE